jgi:hypothetical protein
MVQSGAEWLLTSPYQCMILRCEMLCTILGFPQYEMSYKSMGYSVLQYGIERA